MTNEKILAKLASIKDKVKTLAPAGTENYYTAEIDDLIRDISEEVNQKAASSAGVAEVRAAAMRILKDKANKARPTFQKAGRVDGRAVVTDGYRAVMWEAGEEPQNLPYHDEKIIAEYHAGVAGIVEQCKNPNAEKIEAPNPASLRAYIARNKNLVPKHGGSMPYKVTDFYFVDTQYLIDCLQACDGEVIQAPTNPNKPLYIEGKRGCAILCPLRLSDHLRDLVNKAQ